MKIVARQEAARWRKALRTRTSVYYESRNRALGWLHTPSAALLSILHFSVRSRDSQERVSQRHRPACAGKEKSNEGDERARQRRSGRDIRWARERGGVYVIQKNKIDRRCPRSDDNGKLGKPGYLLGSGIGDQ